MKRRSVSVSVLLMGMLLAAGCGTEPGDAEPAGYAKIAGLNNAIAASKDMNSSPMTSDAENESIPDPPVQEATGNEVTVEREVTEDSAIYGRQGEESAVVGLAEQGTVVQMIDITEGGEWSRIVYKGRVAYIAAHVLAEPAPEVTEAPTARPTARPAAGQRPAARTTPQPTQPPSPEPGTTDAMQEPSSDAPSGDAVQEPPLNPGSGVTQPPVSEPGGDATQEPPPDPDSGVTQPPVSEPGGEDRKSVV